MTALEDAVAVRALLVLESGARFAEVAAEWQVSDSRAFLDDGATVRMHYQTRPRGGSKTDDAAGDACAVLLTQAPAKSRSYMLAADKDQGRLLIDSVDGFVGRTPELAGAFEVNNFSVAATRSGATLEVLPADESSAWGLRPYMATVDEFAQWKSTPGPRRLWRAIFSAMPKTKGRLRVLTSSGDPAHWSHGVLERAIARPWQWRVSQVPGPCPWIAAADLDDQRAELPQWEYERLHLNRWVASDDRLTSLDALRACVTLDGPREHVVGRRYAMGLDLGLKNDRTVVTVCSADTTCRPSLDRIGVWQGSRDRPVSLDVVEAWVVAAWEGYGRPPLIADPYQAAQLIQHLRARGVHVIEYAFTAQSVSRLALRLHQLIADHALELPDDEELIDELANVRLKEPSPGVYRLDHDSDKHDDRAIALALAAAHLTDRAPSGGGTSASAMSALRPLHSRHREGGRRLGASAGGHRSGIRRLR